MYLRTTTRRTKGGETVRYLALAHNERNERGVPVAKVIHNLGREDLLEAGWISHRIAEPSAGGKAICAHCETCLPTDSFSATAAPGATSAAALVSPTINVLT